MKLIPTGLPDAMIVEIEPLGDERGFFARAWCAREFAEHGSGNLQDSARIDTSRCDRSASTRPPGIHICINTAIFQTFDADALKWTVIINDNFIAPTPVRGHMRQRGAVAI